MFTPLISRYVRAAAAAAVIVVIDVVVVTVEIK
jgi:hypothetical protein